MKWIIGILAIVASQNSTLKIENTVMSITDDINIIPGYHKENNEGSKKEREEKRDGYAI